MIPTTPQAHAIIAAPWQLRAAEAKQLGAIILPLVPEPIFHKKRPEDFRNLYTFISQTKPIQMMWYEGFSVIDTIRHHLRYQEGDRIYLAEEWCQLESESFSPFKYWSKSKYYADGHKDDNYPSMDGYFPAETMPPEAAQHWFTITEVRVCQLSTLNPSDYVNCGMFLNMDKISGPWDLLQECRASEERWNAAHPDYPWKSDRHVVVLAMEAIAQ